MLTQQEIASNNSLDNNKSNTVLLYSAIMASIIVFSIGLTIFLLPISGSFAYVSLAFLVYCAYPLYKLTRLKAFYVLGLWAAGLALLGVLCLLQLYIPPLKNTSLFIFLFMALAVAAVGVIFAISRTDLSKRQLNGVTAIVFFMSLSVLLFLFFKDSTAGSIKLTVSSGKIIEFKLKSMALTFGGLGFFSVLIFALCAYLFTQKPKQITTKYITYVATFSALSVIFKLMGNAVTSTLAVFSPVFKFTLVYIPWVAAGIVTGPIGGLIATGIGDFLGQILLPSGGSWFWMTWVSNLLFPLFPSLFYKYLPLKKSLNWLKILLGMVLSSIFCTMGIGTMAIAVLYYSGEYFTALATRPLQLVVVGINYALIVSLLPALKQSRVLVKG